MFSAVRDFEVWPKLFGMITLFKVKQEVVAVSSSAVAQLKFEITIKLGFYSTADDDDFGNVLQTFNA